MKKRSICQRCHRLREVGDGRYCPACNTVLRADERRRPRAVINERPTLDETPESKQIESAVPETADEVADTDPAPSASNGNPVQS